jgi:hypothetical protein
MMWLFTLPDDVLFLDRPSALPVAGSTSIHGVTVTQNIQAYNSGGASMLSRADQEVKVNPQHQINSCIVWIQSSCYSTIQLLDAVIMLHWTHSLTHSLTHSAVASARNPAAIAWRSVQKHYNAQWGLTTMTTTRLDPPTPCCDGDPRH